MPTSQGTQGTAFLLLPTAAVLCLERLALTSCWNIKLHFEKQALYIMLVSYLVSAGNLPLAVSHTLSPPYTLTVPWCLTCWHQRWPAFSAGSPLSQSPATSARCLLLCETFPGRPSRADHAVLWAASLLLLSYLLLILGGVSRGRVPLLILFCFSVPGIVPATK